MTPEQALQFLDTLTQDFAEAKELAAKRATHTSVVTAINVLSEVVDWKRKQEAASMDARAARMKETNPTADDNGSVNKDAVNDRLPAES